MDELAKTEARNYLSAAGFFLLTAFFLLGFLPKIGSSVFLEPSNILHIVIGVGLLVIATLLVVLHKRDMIAILFFMLGFYQLYAAFTSSGEWNIILIGFLVLSSLITLISREKIKWLLFLVPLVMFVQVFIMTCFGYNSTVFIVFGILLAIISLYYAFCCATERFCLPGSQLLTADESTDFKASGSALGYMLFSTAIAFAGCALFSIFGPVSAEMYETLKTVELLCGILLVYVSVLLLAVGKMRFTPVMFFLLGITLILNIYSSGMMTIGIAILLLIVGLFAMLRKESRILPGIMFILLSAVFFLAVAGTAIPSVIIGILEIIVVVMAIYLAFVVYSQKKLPRF